jgi:hypothetical protein
MKLGKGVLFVTQNLPLEMSRIQVLSDSYKMKGLGTTACSVLDERYLLVMLRFVCTQKLRNMETNSIYQSLEILYVAEPPS